MYAIAPLLDSIKGIDSANPPEELVHILDRDPYYRIIPVLLAPMVVVGLISAVALYALVDLSWHGIIALVLTAGQLGGLGITTGHELGHKTSALERFLGKFVLSSTLYGHAYIEHNFGHHPNVATPDDPASARMGESIYKFAAREVPGCYVNAWRIESERLSRLGLSKWSFKNDIIQSTFMSTVLWGALVAIYGLVVLPILLAISAWSNFQLTSGNYVEHYGLKRKVVGDGKFEPPSVKHSWNSNFGFSNLALLHLQRHSDHHSHALRRYQSLRHIEGAPELPHGYFAMFLATYIPPIWYEVMDKRLIETVNGEVDRINFDPSKRQRLIAKFGLEA